ncbi:MAG TPA: ATP-dependent 6-phosphofructokinase [Acidimicrobiia bacterium]|nr:ATP-dependent 6-phosphofructokinase [Acidimicrobiia bacterium]
MARKIGILTAGGDSPGLNAAIRAVGKAAQRAHGMEVIGFKDGFLGLMQDRFVNLHSSDLSGILTRGGTVLGTSRAKVHKIDVGDGTKVDGREKMRQVVERHGLEALVCLGGGGTAKNALKLADVGIPVLTLPKTIDNDVVGTDTTFGFDTAMSIATEAIDRLHSTAHSHHRIIVVELMGHSVGWLALGSGLAGGADVILIPEIPYDVEAVASSISARRAAGSSFSIVAVAEGAISKRDAGLRGSMASQMETAGKSERKAIKRKLRELESTRSGGTVQLASTLAGLTGLESRITILGHVQRGGTPTPADRLLATRLGTACTDFIADGVHGVLVAARGESTEAVPLKEVAGHDKVVPLDHPWVETARHLGVAMGD